MRTTDIQPASDFWEAAHVLCSMYNFIAGYKLIMVVEKIAARLT